VELLNQPFVFLLFLVQLVDQICIFFAKMLDILLDSAAFHSELPGSYPDLIEHSKLLGRGFVYFGLAEWTVDLFISLLVFEKFIMEAV
jgi:hypothetical protein